MFKVQKPFYLNYLKSFNDLVLKSSVSGVSVKLSRLVAVSVSPMLANILIDDRESAAVDESLVLVEGATNDDLEAFLDFSLTGIIPSKAKDRRIFPQLGVNFEELNIVPDNVKRSPGETPDYSAGYFDPFHEPMRDDDEKFEANFDEFEVEDESFETFDEDTFRNSERPKRKRGRPPKKIKKEEIDVTDEEFDDESFSSDNYFSSPEREKNANKPRAKRKASNKAKSRTPKGIKGYDLLKSREKKKFLADGGTEEDWNMKQEESEATMVKRTVRRKGVNYTYFYPKDFEDGSRPKKVVGQRCAKEYTEGTRDESKEFQCDICLFGSNSSEQMQQHEIFHRKGVEGAYYCWECEESFVRPIERQEHLKAAHGNTVNRKRSRKTNCQYCPKKFSPRDPEGLAQHEEEHQTPENQNCFQCGEKFQMGRSSAKKHFEKVGQFHATKKCLQCDYILTSYQDHQGHVMTNHGGNFKYVCGICPSLFDSEMDRKEHKFTEHMEEANRVICDLCGKNFNKLQLKAHMETQHGEKGPCPVEGCKTIVAKYLLDRHMKNYHNPQMCDDCGKQFKGIGRLTYHRRMNHAAKSFQCQYCPKAFNDKKKFDDHINVHTGETPHKCKFCGVGFKNKSNMYHHQRSVHMGIKREDMKRLREIHGSSFHVNHSSIT